MTATHSVRDMHVIRLINLVRGHRYVRRNVHLTPVGTAADTATSYLHRPTARPLASLPYSCV